MTHVASDRFDAVLFDLDGVLTATARIHARAWKQAFDALLRNRADGGAFTPFDIDSDYDEYVDGKPRFDGARDFLQSRGIDLPPGNEDDDLQAQTVRGVANAKNVIFEKLLREDDVTVYDGVRDCLGRLRREGVKTAVVTSSSHCDAVLQNAGLEDLFDARMDGNIAEAKALPGKPAPDTYLEAARMLGVSPERAVVVEDALSGVAAGRKGGFGLVVGVDRRHEARALREHGADIVVRDLRDMLAG